MGSKSENTSWPLGVVNEGKEARVLRLKAMTTNFVNVFVRATPVRGFQPLLAEDQKEDKKAAPGEDHLPSAVSYDLGNKG